MRRTNSAKFALTAIIAGLVFLATSPAIRAEDFYPGKTIRFISFGRGEETLACKSTCRSID